MTRKFLKKHHLLLVCVAITAIFVALTATTFRGAFFNIAVAFVQLWHALVTYFTFLFTQTLPPTAPITPPAPPDYYPPPYPSLPPILPDTPAEFRSNIGEFFRRLISPQNFINYALGFEEFLVIFLSLLPMLLLLGWLIKRRLRKSFTKHNNRYNQDTKALKAFKCLSKHTYHPIKHFILTLHFYVTHTYFKLIWLILWAFNLNLIAVAAQVIAMILYFPISLNLVALYNFLLTVISLLAQGFSPVPLWILIPLIVIFTLYILDKMRKRLAYNKLHHLEMCNRGFLNERSICMLLVGTVGKGKTTHVTDMALSTEALFRHNVRQTLLDIDMQFPHFPWIMLEKEMQREMDALRIFNLASAAKWIRHKKQEFENAMYCRQFYKPLLAQNACKKDVAHLTHTHYKRLKCKRVAKQTINDYLYTNRFIFDYDFEKYGMHHDNALHVLSLWNALAEYVKAYFIYFINTSLILANYSIRTDFVQQNFDNLPRWDLDFYHKDSRLVNSRSRYCHILDFDMIRLAKKMLKNNVRANTFEFGVIAITEVGKERGNQFKDVELKEERKRAEEPIQAKLKVLRKDKQDTTELEKELAELNDLATQSNDKMNAKLKLIRHTSTVNHYPYAKVILDEQRPESLGADARDLCEIVHIKDKSEPKMTLGFTFIGELFYDLVWGRFKPLYDDFRTYRGDNTLLMHLLKILGAGVHNYHNRIENRFSYTTSLLEVEQASTGQIIKESEYYLVPKKIYSKRFDTAAYSGMFTPHLENCKVGLMQIPEYQDVTATAKEFKEQHSYLVGDIERHANPKKKQKGKT